MQIVQHDFIKTLLNNISFSLLRLASYLSGTLSKAIIHFKNRHAFFILGGNQNKYFNKTEVYKNK